MTPLRAVTIGSFAVNGPVLAILIGGVWFCNRFDGILYFATVFPFFAVAWLYWSLAVGRWRVWAARAGADPDATQRLAVWTGLTWPKGWIFEKMEIPPE